MNSLPSSSGTYALILQLTRPAVLQIGRLGETSFPAGNYVYLGSAFGPGGLQARLGRHLRGESRRHWHIDYLRSAAQVAGFCYAITPVSQECYWCQALALQPGAWIPARGFGASDCRARHRRCPAHLLAFSRPVLATELSKVLALAEDQQVEAVMLADAPGE